MLWWHIGTAYEQIAVIVTDTALVQVIPGVDEFIIDEFSSGQPLDLALVEGDAKRAHAKVIPFPIEARAEGGCTASVELRSRTGRLFLIVLSGFAPGEPVHTSHSYGTELLEGERLASPRGVLQIPMLFDPSDEGAVSLTATGRTCSVTVPFQVGTAAIDRP